VKEKHGKRNRVSHLKHVVDSRLPINNSILLKNLKCNSWPCFRLYILHFFIAVEYGNEFKA
jgi:hypothetical protein